MAHLRGLERSKFVAAMFARIAHRYDLMNGVMTLGMHHQWRRRCATLATEGVIPGLALDVAAGTGDLSFELSRHSEIHGVIGLDFVSEMLVLAQNKQYRQDSPRDVAWIRGDAVALPFPNSTFTCVTSAFSMRNIIDPIQALKEMERVVEPGGRVVILDIMPDQYPRILSSLTRFYFRYVTPTIGGLITGDWEAYRYLPKSAEYFPSPRKFRGMMEEVGLHVIRQITFGLGLISIHVGVKESIDSRGKVEKLSQSGGECN